MFTQLPNEIQHIVYGMLNVEDRVKLAMALPKQSNAHVVTYPKQREKKLGLIAGAIRKHQIPKMTTQIRRFLSSCEQTDPTIAEIAEQFPEVKSDNFNQNHTKQLAKDIVDGTTTIDEIKTIIKTYNDIEQDEDIRTCMYRAKPRGFKLLMECPVTRDYIVKNQKNIFFNMFNYRNPILVNHIVNVDGFGLDIPSMRASVAKSIQEYCYSMVYIPESLDMILKYLNLDERAKDKLWLRCMENMQVDAAVMIRMTQMT